MGRLRSYLKTASSILDEGWLSRLFLFAQFYLAYFMVDWAMAFGSTALTMKADLLGAAAVIGSVAAVPQALLMMATNKYMEMRQRNGDRASADRNSEIYRTRED